MNKRLFIINAIITIGLIVLSCKNDYQPTYRDFEKRDTAILLQKIELDSVYLTYAQMKIDQGLCCIADYDGKNHFHIYSFPDFNYLYSFGRKGKSNDEIITLLDFTFQDNKVGALCGGSRKIVEYDLKTGSNSVVKMDKDVMILSMCDIDNDNYISTALYGDRRINIISKEGKITKQLVDLPKGEERISKENSHWIGPIEVSPDGKYAVSPMQYGEIIDIINLEVFNHVRAIGPLGPPKYIHERSGGVIYHLEKNNCFEAMNLQSRIYLYFNGRDITTPEIKENCICVYDYSGSPICKHYIGEIEPSSIYVDEENGYLYCLVPEDDNKIYKYKIEIL